MQKSSLLVVVLVLVVSTLLLSALFYNMTGYYGNTSPHDKEHVPPGKPEEQPYLVFVVSPACPTIYWRVSTEDYYDGFEWSSTTIKRNIEEFPKAQNYSDIQIFSVEMNTTKKEVFLPVPPSKTSVSSLVLSPQRNHELFLDDVADVYGIRIPEQRNGTEIVYQAVWDCVDYEDIDGRLVSLDDVPREIRTIYLQLPSLPEAVWELAERLKHSSYNVLDQILADVQYLRTYFDYDVDLSKGRTQRVINRDWVFSYMQWRKGVCLDAATALTVILRCQGIPARMSFGFKSDTVYENKTYYFSTGAHAETEAYLPHYGWVQFDATPPLADSPRLELTPIKAEGYLGENIFYHLKVTNKRNVTDTMRMSIHDKEKWNGKVIPKELSVEPFDIGDALIKITIPMNGSSGETNLFTVNAKSLFGEEFFVMAVAEVRNAKRLPTITRISSFDQFIFRGDFLTVEGEVCTENNKSVDNVPVFLLLSEAEEEKSIVVSRSYSSIGLFRMVCQVPMLVEYGVHSFVAISLGDSTHAPSTSLDAVVIVGARTSMKLNVKSPTFVGDQVTVLGYLFLDNGTSVQNARITLETQFQDNPLISWKWQTFTDVHGVFFTMCEERFTHPGLFKLNVTFQGDNYTGCSSLAHTISVSVGTPTIQSFTESCLVRGEVCLVRGMVKSNETGIWKEPVTIALDGHQLSTVDTDFDGNFSYVLVVNPEEELGSHTLSFLIHPRRLELSQEVNVMAKTELKVISSRKVSGKEQLSIRAVLLDDNGLPVPEADILIENCGLAGRTDRDGKVKFLLETFRILPENIGLTLRFEGSDIYLPTVTSVRVAAEPVVPIIFLLPVVISVTVILGFVTNRYVFERKAGVSTTKQQEKLSTVEAGQETLLRISFPDIRNSFPNVWGVGERLRVECLLNRRMQKKNEGRTVELFVNGKKSASSILSKRCATFSQMFETKGIYQVRARVVDELQPQTATAVTDETMLRVVDYREEIVSLYGTFLQSIDQNYVRIEDEMTAREIESLLLNTGKLDAKGLQKVTECFEKAEYSIHPIQRNDYETIYQCLKELKFDADKII